MTDRKSLLLPLAGLSGLSLYAVYSSTQADAGAAYAIRQAIWIGLGVGAMLAASRVRAKTLAAVAPLIYVGAVLMLALVLIVGRGPQGTRRWFELGLLRFQPSELAKMATILLLSRFLAERGPIGDSIRSVLQVFAFVGLPALLVLYEPDMGTALVIAFVAFPMLYASGLDPLYLLFLISPFIAVICAGRIVAWVLFVGLLVMVVLFRRFKTSLVALVFGINLVLYTLAPKIWSGLAPYQRDRVQAFLNPENFRHGAGFQIIQSKIAVGSGGLAGKGLFEGTQKALGLVPAQHTDFVFSLIAEEMGFAGGVLVLLLLLALVMKIFGIARAVRNRFSSYVCFGFASLILIQVYINVGMTLGLTPVTGLPLPFVSYGGSQAIVFWGMIGIVFSAYASRREY
jgi:rod shape determining protein RodA